MNKKITVGTSIALIFFAILLAFSVTYVCINKSYQNKLEENLKYAQIYQKLYNFDSIIREKYIGEIDGNSVMDGMLAGYLNGLGDKYARYYTAEEYGRYELEMTGKVVGIGITVHYNSEKNAAEIVNVTEGSPAFKMGLKVGDFIRQVYARQIVIAALSFVPSWWLTSLIGQDCLMNVIVSCCLTVLLTLGLIYLIGLDSSERDMLTSRIRAFLNRK